MGNMIEFLQSFCDVDHHILSSPFSDEKYTYASNGHMAIRVDRVPEIDREPPFEAIKTMVFEADRYQAIPDYHLPGKVKCKECSGTGKTAACPECEGSGYVCFSNEYNDYECTCETCWGKGKKAGKEKECEDCGGTGECYASRYEFIDVGWKTCGVNAFLLEKIKELPNVEISLTAGENKPIPFRFDNGHGILMPMSK